MARFDRVKAAFMAAALAGLAVRAGAACPDAITPSPEWRETFTLEGDPFAAPGWPESDWVKLSIRTCDPTKVIFQDSRTYRFHHEFAAARLDPYLGITPQAFDAITLHEAGQELVLGAVIVPPWTAFGMLPEYGIQLVRQDAYAPAMAADLLDAIRAGVSAAPGVKALYFPTFEQAASAEANRAFFAARGYEVSSADRWAVGNACYAHGWAVGTLKYFAPADIQPAFLRGDLRPADVLLTDAVPAEIPPLAGVVTLSAATPNSHVAILARTFGIPFAHLALARDAQEARDLVGRVVLLRADERAWGGCRVRLVDASSLDAGTLAAILALKQPPPLAIQPMEAFGALSAPTDGLLPADVRFFGGKASHFGILRRAIPANSPPATAFSFDLWNAFMDQTLVSGRTLRQDVATRVAGFSWPPDALALSQALAGVRDLIKDTARTNFSPSLQAGVVATLEDPRYGFDPMRNVRFRSSTNVEDTASFTGAGLHDSFSGCLADDQDADLIGPSLCDPTETGERGVYRAIRRVFASFYNENAFMERLRHGVDETTVGMALLAHHSYPDDVELANGVATLEDVGGFQDAELVSQLGAVPVTNPVTGAIPEEVEAFVSGGNVYPSLVRSSNLVQRGATVLEMPGEYEELVRLLLLASAEYSRVTGQPTATLDFEYKKEAPGGVLMVKQVRPIPAPTGAAITPFLLDEPVTYCPLQGEGNLVFASHRLKARWELGTRSTWLTDAELQQTFLVSRGIDVADGCGEQAFGEPFAAWPEHAHAFAAGESRDSWAWRSLQLPRELTAVLAPVPTRATPPQPGVLVLGDLGFEQAHGEGCFQLEARYPFDVPSLDWSGMGTTRTDLVTLCPCLEPDDRDIRRSHLVEDLAQGVSVATTYFWPPMPTGIVAGYTAPLSRFESTTITGLTDQPLVLTSSFAQTYEPGHHNFTETFLFEPALDPGVTDGQVGQLRARGVRGILVRTDFVDGTITLLDDATWAVACGRCQVGDGDLDGRCADGAPPDCDDTRPDVWERPGLVGGIRFTSKDVLEWDAPDETGGLAVAYDVLRSRTPSDFASALTCVAAADPTVPRRTDTETPGAGVFHYVARARNGCPDGLGSLGADSRGLERLAPACP